MKKIFNRKSFMCLVLSMVMLMGMSTTSLAASGSTYGYSNLNLTWTTSANSASATLRSGTKAGLVVYIVGMAYSGRLTQNFYGTSGQVYGLTATARVSRKYTKISGTEAHGIRNNSQTIVANMYY